MDQPFSLAYGQGINSKTDSKQVIPGKLLRLENAVFTDEKRINKRNGNTALPLTTIGTSTNAVAAQFVNADNIFTLTAVTPGVAGNAITFQINSIGTPGTVTVTGTAIAIVADAGTTGTVLVAAVNGYGPAAALVTAAVITVNAALVVTADAAINPLSGGIDATSESSSTIASPRAMKSLKDDLVCAGALASTGARRMFSYSEEMQAWADKGKYDPSKITVEVISDDVTQNNQSGAYSSPYIAALWTNVNPVSSVTSIYATIQDSTTNAFILPETHISDVSIFSTSSAARIVVIDTHKFMVIYFNSGNALAGRIITVSTPNVTIGTEIIFVAAADSPDAFFAISASGTGAAIAYDYYSGGTVLKMIITDASGSVIHTGTVSSSGGSPLAINFDGTNYWVYYGASTIHYTVLNNTLASTLASQVNTGILDTPNITSLSVSATSQKIYYSVGGGNTSASLLTYTGPTVVTSLVMINTRVATGPFTLNNITYLGLKHASAAADQSAMIFIDLADSRIVAKCMEAITLTSTDYLIPLTPMIQGTDKVSFVSGYLATASDKGTLLLSLDFGDQDLYQALVANNCLEWNGGFVGHYDGQAFTELGFIFYPEITGSNVTATGSIAAGVYEYFAIFAWADRQGNYHQSSPSIGTQVTVGVGGASAITLTYLNLGVTLKQDTRFPIQINFYRTDASGTLPHLIGTATNSTTSATGTFRDTNVGPLTGVTPYTTGGILENICPPPTVVMVEHNTRVFLTDSQNPNNIWYCKTLQPGVGASFSDLLVNQIDSRGGDIKALGDMDEKLVILEEKQPFVVSGDGANDAGQGASFSFPQPVPSDVGASQSKAVFTSPMGIHFKTPKGLFLLDRSLSVKYWGADIEAYNNQDITSALIMPGTTQMRFLTSDGLTLCYDYFFGQWSTFTNFEGVAADIWQGTYTYVRSDGAIYQENFTTFLDDMDAFAVKAQTAWIKGGIIQGFQRIKEFLHLGDYANGSDPLHGVQVSIAYDYLANPDLPNFTDAVPFYFGDASTSGAFQYRQFLEQQKCEAATFFIEELPTGASGENFNLTDMTILAGVKKGAFKLASAQTAS